jgi:hypothetical protein
MIEAIGALHDLPPVDKALKYLKPLPHECYLPDVYLPAIQPPIRASDWAPNADTALRGQMPVGRLYG